MQLVHYLMVLYVSGIVHVHLLVDFPLWVWKFGLGRCYSVSPRLFPQGAGLGHHSRPEEVNDGPKVVRRRLRHKTPGHLVVGRGSSPPPKRRKWLSLPGPSRGYQESSYFPRVGEG